MCAGCREGEDRVFSVQFPLFYIFKSFLQRSVSAFTGLKGTVGMTKPARDVSITATTWLK